MYKICLVEDEESLNDLITSYLKKEGYENNLLNLINVSVQV